MKKLTKVEEKYSKGHFLYNKKLGTTLNISGFPYDFDVLSDDVVLLKEGLKKMENGEICNTTEKQAADHYNLRHEKELVKGKSLKISLAQWSDINERVSKILESKKFTDVIFNGIGGSILGPVLLIIGMKGTEYFYDKTNKIRIHFLNNTDSDSFALMMKNLDFRKTILVTMSKSGGTLESMTNYRCFNKELKKLKVSDIGTHHICITKRESQLDKIGKENKFAARFYMNKETGGRTSVGSAIGMVPAAFAGLDFKKFLFGQCEMDKVTRDFQNIKENIALVMATAIHHFTKSQSKNMIVLGYSDFLKEYAHYLQQLYMESLGKEKDNNLKVVNEGQTVFGGVGTCEQHAFMQQVQRGLKDCFVRLIYFSKREYDFVLKGDSKCQKCTMGRNLLAFLKGTEYSLIENKRPYMTTSFEKRDMYNMGLMIALEERIVTFLGLLKEINAYDQPGVELGKKSAKKMVSVLREIVEFILKNCNEGTWSGNALKMKSEMKKEEYPIDFIDAGLSDIYFNIDVENSYTELYKKYSVTRDFNENMFVYNIKKV